MKRGMVLICILFAFSLNLVLAAMPPPEPSCYIEGTISSVEFQEAWENDCLTSEYGCPTDVDLSTPDRYKLTIKIDSASYVSGDDSFSSCEDVYPLDSYKVIILNDEDVLEGDSFESNQKISGQASSVYLPTFDYYEVQEGIIDEIIDGGDEITGPTNFKLLSFWWAYLIVGIIVGVILFWVIKKLFGKK